MAAVGQSMNKWAQKGVIVAMLAVLALASIAQMVTIARCLPMVHSDLWTRVIGTRYALKGIDPYSAEVSRVIQTHFYGHPLPPNSTWDPEHFDYPALIVPLLAPFANLPWRWVQFGFLLVTIPAFVASSYWWAKRLLPSASSDYRLALVGLSLFAWPTVWAFRVQQPTIAFALLITAGSLALVREWDVVAGVCMAVALIKPQVSLPLVLWFTAWSIRHRRGRFPVSLLITLAGLTGAAEWMVPGWFHPWVADVTKVGHFTTPIYRTLLGNWLGGGLIVLLGAWSIWLLWGMLDAESNSRRFVLAVSLALAATLMLTPVYFAAVYDAIFLIPAIFLIAFAKPKRRVTRVFQWIAMGWITFSFILLLVFAIMSLTAPDVPFPSMLLMASYPILALVLPPILLIAEEQEWSSTGFMQWRKRARKAERTESAAA